MAAVLAAAACGTHSENGPAKMATAAEDGWYSKIQADTGATLFAAHCQVCHGAKLEGGAGPALAGPQFFARFGGQPMSRLWYGVHTEMPLTAPSSLPSYQSLDLVAFILRQNKFPAGPYELVGHYDMNRMIPMSAPGGEDAGALALAAVDTTVRQPSTSAPSQSELDAADTAASDWLGYGKGYRNARYSALGDISAANVSGLKRICSVELGEGGAFEGTPVAYGGVLYVTSTHNTLAIDGATCAIKWKHTYTPSALEAAHNNKGLAIGGGRAIRGTTDGHLIALDLQTGALLWNKQIMDSRVGESAIAAPLIWNDLVFMAKAGGDLGVQGEVMAFHVADGTKVWGFFTVPTGRETGAGTWTRAGTAAHGGGGNWSSFAIDAATGTLLSPVGNPAPDFMSDARPGENLFTTGVIALDARSGRLKWWYQTQPHDVHDWDATGAAVFTTGAGKSMVAVTAKDGYVHLLDGATGKLLTKTQVTTRSNDTAPLTTQGTHYCPGVAGGEEWNGAAISRANGMLYVNAVDWCNTVKLSPADAHAAFVATGGGAGFGGGIALPDSLSAAHGWTTALDAATGAQKWHVRMPTPMVAAVTPTAGGVVFTGDLNGDFLALDAATGKTLFSQNTGGAMAGGVITYRAGGKQFVAAASGNTSYIAWTVTGKPTVVIFGL
jgi:PQQ-dependent dehydrogenase (methanol/ethanol family)